MFTENQIEMVAMAVRKAMREMKQLSSEAVTPRSRLEQRIMAILARSDTYVEKYPALRKVLEGMAMPKTMIRKCLGGNTLAMDEALRSLVQQGKVIYYTQWRGVPGRAMDVYQRAEVLDRLDGKE